MVIMISFNIIMNLVMMSSSNWFIAWTIVELVGFVFLMMLAYTRSSSANLKVIIWKYYLFQCIGSMVLLMVMFVKVSQISYFNGFVINLVMMISIMMKLGLPPFHKWAFEVSENLDWLKFLIINTLQKTPVLFLLWNLVNMDLVSMSLMMFTALFSLISLFDWSFRRFLMYSAILNYTWIIMSSMLDSMTMIMFTTIYFSSFMAVVVLMSKFSYSCFSMLYNNNSIILSGPMLNMIMTINIMSIAGMPPLAGFIAKYELVTNMIWNNLVFLSLLFVLVSMIMLIMYIFIMLSSSISSKVPIGWMGVKDTFVVVVSVVNLILPVVYFF